MKLFYLPGACSLAPHIVLREAGLPFELVRVDLKSQTTADGKPFGSISSKGQVPALQLDDGEVLTEGPVIAQYVADQVPARRLIPEAGSRERYRVTAWQNFITSELHKGYTPLFNPLFDAAARKVAADILLRKFTWVDSQLGEDGWLCGPDFTVADAYLYVVAGWSAWVSLDLSQLPRLQAYLARVAARPAVQAARAAEGLKG